MSPLPPSCAGLRNCGRLFMLMMLLPGRPALRLGTRVKALLPKEDGVLEEDEVEELIAPRAEAAATERSRRLLLFFASLSSKWRGVVEKDW